MFNQYHYLKKTLILIIVFSTISGSHLFAETIHLDKLVNMGTPINSAGPDFSPSLTADGKILVFNSKRNGSKFEHIYICSNEKGTWTAPVPIKEINSAFNDESPFITQDGEFIFFSSDRDGSFEMPKDPDGVIRVSFDIYVSKKIDGSWDTPIKLPGTVNTSSHERTPGLSADSKTLFYTSMPFGDVSKARIMKADYVNGEFINPAPLPAPVNVGAQDTGLVPSFDGKGYYFSSKRAGGYGGWDLYYVKFENGAFGEPFNLGPEINSPKNEIYLSIINDTIYFCSDRDGGYGSYDIYTAKFSLVDDSLKIVVRDKNTKKPVKTELNISTKVKESEESAVTYQIKKRTDEKGEATVKHNPRVNNLDVIIEEEGYLPLFETIDIPASAGKPRILELIPIEKEASFDIHSIYFDFESAKIKSESYPYLDALAGYLTKHKSMRFEIIGHTDLHGTDEFNDKLSLDRAKSVKNYLNAKGIDNDRLTVKGSGKRHPVVPEIGPGFDEKNRRTEFKLLEK